MSDEIKRIDDTDYDELCSDCQSKVGLDVPQYHGMVAFKGDFQEPTCDKCGVSLLP